MRLTLFRRQLALTFAVMLAFILIGSLASFLVAESERRSEHSLEHDRLRPSPARFAARLYLELTEKQRMGSEEALALLNRTHGSETVFKLFSAADVPKALLGDEALPTEVLTPKWIRHGPFGPPSGEIVRITLEPANYLLFTMDRGPGRGAGGPPDGRPPGLPPGPPPDGHGPPGSFNPMFFTNLMVLGFSVILAVVVSLFYLFHSMRSKAELAESVLAEMRAGNLKARFPVKRLDEVGQLMQKFNAMAEEIEHLVERLKDTEIRRTRLLQELAHDLRTPVASLKSFAETLHLRENELQPRDRAQLVLFSLKEINYLERLVEDLLFLAQVTEPKYLSAMKKIDINEIAHSEADRIQTRPRSKPLKVERDLPAGEVLIEGDLHLIRRMFHNALDNAASFAKSEVRVGLTLKDDETVIITVRDDGPGLSAEALSAFGEKRVTRVVTQADGRLSVGLGSVIMRAVASVHHGRVEIHNSQAPDGTVLGAEVVISLRRSN